jgi:hypothetical protein
LVRKLTSGLGRINGWAALSVAERPSGPLSEVYAGLSPYHHESDNADADPAWGRLQVEQLGTRSLR